MKENSKKFFKFSNKDFSSNSAMILNKLNKSLKDNNPSLKDSQTLQLEKALNINNIPTYKPSLKEIFEKKDINFENQYILGHSLYSSIYCFVKIGKDYENCKLTVSDRNIIVEVNKKMMKFYKWSLSEISTKNAKNISSNNEIPNYHMNDTIDKILTGRNTNNINNQFHVYLLNINLDLVTCKLIIHKEKQKFRLLLLGNKKHNSDKFLKKIKKIKFNCLNVERSSFYQICEIINKSILLSDGYKKNFFGVNFRKNYYTKQFISVLNFVKEANTGDILLFKSYTPNNKCKTCISKSEYDHIALLIKTENNLRLYDSNEEIGVSLKNFTDYISNMWYLLYDKIVYRKLNINIEDIVHYIKFYNNKQENIGLFTLENVSVNEIKNKLYKILNNKLEIFIQKFRNIKYDFPTCSFLCKSKKTKYRDLNRNSFFSSELVAAVYMFCDIMSKKYDPNSYLPGDFSEKGKIDFINGFHLGPEAIIEFSS